MPWGALVDEGIVLNKDGSFQRTARFRGPDLDSAVPAELVAIAGRLNNALRRLDNRRPTAWGYLVREIAKEARLSETTVREYIWADIYRSHGRSKINCTRFGGFTLYWLRKGATI